MKKLLLSALITLSLFYCYSSYAENPSPYSTEWRSSAEQEGSERLIIGEYKADDSQISAALDIKLKDNWHTYWKHPGDAGMSHQIDFSKSENVKDVKILWPTPERFISYDLESWSYKGDVLIPLAITVADNTKPAKIDFTVKWAICDEICIFQEDNFTISTNPGDKDEQNISLISEGLKQVADSEESSKLKITSIKHLPNKILTVEVQSEEPLAENADTLITEESKSFRFPKPKAEIAEDRRSAKFITKYEQQVSTVPLEGKQVEINFINGKNSVSQKFDVTVPEGSAATPEKSTQPVDSSNVMQPTHLTANDTGNAPATSVLYAILAALLGGLILNIMPCVLPVLSIKVMSVISLGGSDKKIIRQSFLFTVIGIISSFLLLAAFTIILKNTGQLAGWGTQFQHPIFIIFLLCILSIFAANLLGFFEFNLHSKLADKIHERLDQHNATSKLGSFFTGAFATLLATPCTAPFLVTAISFALSQGPLQIIYIFFFMGVGLALPYILVLISPSLIKLFPRPGKWMVTFKKFLGLLLILTMFWLIFVIGGLTNFFSATSTFVCIAIFFWLIWYANRKKLSKARFMLCIAYIFAITCIAPVYFFQPLEKKMEAAEFWKPFSFELVKSEIEKGNTVFVDVTADWCLTCQFNKKRIIYPMLPYLKEQKVVGIEADFTAPNKEISDFLAMYKVYGIPFNIVYGPKAPQGIPLPVLLTEDNVKDAIKKASGN